MPSRPHCKRFLRLRPRPCALWAPATVETGCWAPLHKSPGPALLTKREANVIFLYGFPGGASGKKKKICLPRQETQEMQVQSLGREDSPGEGNGNPLRYSHPGNPMDRGAWRGVVRGAAETEQHSTWVPDPQLYLFHDYSLLHPRMSTGRYWFSSHASFQSMGNSGGKSWARGQKCRCPP